MPPWIPEGPFPVRWTGLLALTLGMLCGCRAGSAEPSRARAGDPVVRDSRLEIRLFASDPEIVTPIGIAIDGRDRLFVLESHTHTPPSGYSGPGGDRVKVLVDHDRDGVPDSVSVFAEGLEDGMNLAFSPRGELYVVTARAVWALHDRDGDGVSENRTRVLNLAEPAQVYDHAALLGIAFSPDGWMYVSRGNTGGAAWRLEGTDGSAVDGYGDGGNIVRSLPDGSRLSEVATGFWNAFDLEIDRHGRVLAVDNDPDSRGPNRLVHVVQGGDYGYRSLYGGSGIHPYLAWNGELPGTLPYAAGLGEAPSGLLDAGLAALPPEYAGDLLATIWEESRIVRLRPTPRGTSLAAEVEPLVDGGPEFRPVAMAADRHGTIYVTDWVVREYPNHGRGRIWRLSTREGAAARPRDPAAAPPPDPGGEALRSLLAADAPEDFGRLRKALLSDDPFVRHAATVALARPVFGARVAEATRDPHPRVRLGALLALRRSGPPDAEAIARRLLRDPDPLVRQSALIWAGQGGMTSLRPDLDRAITAGPVTPALFEVYLATVQQLAPEFVAGYRSRAERYSRNLARPLPPGFLESFVADASRPGELRALALAHLGDPGEHAGLLASLARTAREPELRLEAVRSLAFVPDSAGAAALLHIARSPAEPAALRADALAALGRQPRDVAAEVARLLDDPEPEVRLQATRYLRKEGDSGPRPASLEQWRRALASGGDPERGRRVFFAANATCAQCHTVDRRGGDLGPDLSHVGSSKTREQLVHSILRPSDEITPEWQGWYIRDREGRVHHGRQIDVGGGGRAEMYVLPGRFVSFEGIQEYGPAERSLMPDGLENLLTVAELRDLVAFLEHRR